ncbi:MAG: hypothetical protein GY852_04275 [bacterium]|nr:hypothetical protein [bacterium]
MAIRNIHKTQPLAQRSKTLRQIGSVSALQNLPKWQKYLKFGKIAEELGKKDAATRWRKKAYGFALDHGKYVEAEALANAYLDKKATDVANALALLRENVSSGRTNGDLQFLVATVLRVGTPRDLVAWEVSRERITCPELTFHAWKNNPVLYGRVF